MLRLFPTISPAGTAAYCSGGSVTTERAGDRWPDLPMERRRQPYNRVRTAATYWAKAVGSYTLNVAAGTGCSSEFHSDRCDNEYIANGHRYGGVQALQFAQEQV